MFDNIRSSGNIWGGVRAELRTDELHYIVEFNVTSYRGVTVQDVATVSSRIFGKWDTLIRADIHLPTQYNPV